MSFRISPAWWPVLVPAVPVAAPLLFLRNQRFRKNQATALKHNGDLILRTGRVDLPELEFIELTVLVEEKTAPGFSGEAGVSYLFRTDQGSLLFDLGFGAEGQALVPNIQKLGISLSDIDAVAISHLHLDHMGGMKAQKARTVMIPEELEPREGTECFVPEQAQAPGLSPCVVEGPRILSAGIASTGPLAVSLFFFGLTMEQSLVARLRGRGLVVFTGCGHPGIKNILAMVKSMSCERVYAIGGGLHFPITGSRIRRAGLNLQTFMGTGRPPWKRITDLDLDQAITEINEPGPQKVLLSAHDTCDHAIERMQAELDAEVELLEAGAKYVL